MVENSAHEVEHLPRRDFVHHVAEENPTESYHQGVDGTQSTKLSLRDPQVYCHVSLWVRAILEVSDDEAGKVNAHFVQENDRQIENVKF